MSPRTGPVYNPATGEQIGAVPFATAGDVDAAVQAARDALPAWREMSLAKRAELFFRIRGLVKEHQTELAEIVTREHGKVLSDAALYEAKLAGRHRVVSHGGQVTVTGEGEGEGESAPAPARTLAT